MLVRRATWEMEADVVVVGCGAAGATAAIAASQAGATAIIIEKQAAQLPANNSLFCGGIFICPNDGKEAARYMDSLLRAGPDIYWTDPEFAGAWAEETSHNKQWVESMGAVPHLLRRGAPHSLPGAEAIDVYRVPGMGPGLMRLLTAQLDKRDIETVHGMRARNLLTNAGGEVIGVKVETTGGRAVNVKARRAVVLATGGFEFDEAMKLQYLKVYPAYFAAAPSLTGDGVRMGAEAGAQLWHMNCCSGSCVMKFPEVTAGIRHKFGGQHWVSPGNLAAGHLTDPAEPARLSKTAASAGYIVTDRSGRRYANENFESHAFIYELTVFDSRRLIYPRLPSHWIFDQKRIDAGPLADRTAGPTGPAGIYQWSTDNEQELRRGWIKRADTPGRLAETLRVDETTLRQSIEKYNGSCNAGIDSEFGREPQTLVPLDQPPYYAVPLWPGGLNTLGGPRRNIHGQVINAGGIPIPRLFSAGELGSMYGMLYPGGGANLAECFAFGRVAGHNAAECAPR